MIKVETNKETRVCQGDIIKNVEFIEYLEEEEGNIFGSKIVYPFVMVLTQDCDLEQDFNIRDKDSNDKTLISILVAPLYNAEHVFSGEHLSNLGLKMEQISKKTPGKYLISNDRPRYHYLEFHPDIKIASSIIDFKHYFSVNLKYLEKLKSTNFVCTVSVLFREQISHRFAGFLSRIGLP